LSKNQRSNLPVDEVIREVREIKEQFSRKHDFDVYRIAADLQAQEKLSGRKIVSRSLPGVQSE
jgi:hypothetical protein